MQRFLLRSSHLPPSQGIDSANSTTTLHPQPVCHPAIQPRPLPSSMSSLRPLPRTSLMMHTRPGPSLPSNNMLLRPTTPSPRASKHPEPSWLPCQDSRTSKLSSMPHLMWCLLHLQNSKGILLPWPISLRPLPPDWMNRLKPQSC